MIREEWLIKAIELFKPYFKQCGLTIPAKVKVSIGFPAANIRKTVGQAWAQSASKGKFHEVFISPVADNKEVATSDGILEILTHELLHVIVGIKEGHKKAFKRAMKKIGLEGKATSTNANAELQSFFKIVANKLGTFPHRALDLKSAPVKKQTTRLIKVGCSKCDYIVRVTRIHLTEKGAPLCPVHKIEFEEI